MARNKRKKIKDKDNVKTVRKDAKRRWKNKKAQEKALKNAAALKPAGPINDQKAKDDLDIDQACERKKEKAAQPKKRDRSSDVKEINLVEIVCTEKSLGCATFSVCHLAYYRSILVAVKEFRMNSNKSRSEVKREQLREARMVNHLGAHQNLPLLFGVLIKGEQLMSIMQFHRERGKSVTLSVAIKKKKLEKSEWLDIREFKQIATASFNTATGSKIIQLRVIAHVSRSHPAVAGNPSTPVGRFWRSLWYVDLCCYFLRFIQTVEQF